MRTNQVSGVYQPEYQIISNNDVWTNILRCIGKSKIDFQCKFFRQFHLLTFVVKHKRTSPLHDTSLPCSYKVCTWRGINAKKLKDNAILNLQFIRRSS